MTEIIANRYNNGIIFLLDEPASNLHIHPQEKILAALRGLSADPNVSVIYSTHSPYLIDANSSVGNIFIVTNDADDKDANIRCADITNIDLGNNA
ncbi:MAG: AAA family ATPase, partial [Alphaproteobacteria bacterium]|nr:AAA family ATPase [Alphaproteobacteria bacterium]